MRQFKNLATEWRPQTYAEVVGQPTAVTTLKKIAHSKGIAARSIFLHGSWGSGKCVDPETVVRTKDGLRKAKDLRSSSFSILGKENAIFTTQKNTETEVYKVETEAGRQFSVTWNHPVLVWNGSKYEFVQAKDLKEGDCLLADITEQKQTKLCEFEYIVGLLLGDGVITDFMGKSMEFLSTDVELTDFIESYCKKNYCYYTKEIVKRESKLDQIRLRFNAYSALTLKCKELGILGHKSWNKVLPNSFWSWTFDQQVSLLQGVMDTDGAINKDGSAELTMGAFEVVRGLSYVVQSLGFDIRLQIRKARKETQHGSLRLQIIRTQQGQTCKSLVRLPRKIKNCVPVVNITQSKKFIYPNTVPDVVKIISKEKVDYTIDVQCTTDPVFFTNGIVTHNTTLCKIFAKSLNCNKFEDLDDVCNDCDGCKAASAKNSQLYYEFNSADVGVDKIRDLQELFQVVPQGRRVFVFDECHSASTAALNALLKVIEDGVRDSIFVFASTEDILPTIKSRSVCIDINPIPKEFVKQRVRYVAEQEKIDINDEDLELLALKAHGHMRDALSILNYYAMAGRQALQTSLGSVRDFTIKCLQPKNHEAALQCIQDIMGYNVADIRESIYLFIRQVFLAQKGTPEYWMLQNGWASRLLNYWFSPSIQCALKEEVGIELALRSFWEKCKPKK